MKHILCKILLHNKTHPVVAASFMIIGAYIGYLIWYILDSYLPAAAADNGYVFVSLISVWLCAFWGIYQLPDQLCKNRRIKMILCYPGGGADDCKCCGYEDFYFAVRNLCCISLSVYSF